MTYSSLSKRFPKHSYFCGWYFRCLSNKQTLAIIPSVHKTKDSAFCTIQVITDTHAFHVQFPYDDFWGDDDQIRISNNRFGKSGFSLDIHTPEFHVAGSVHFGAFTPIKYDIMGPFQYIPFMQCRHSVYSMHHRVDGEIQVNGVPYVFDNAVGYVEGDRGCSFPKEYAWTQCSFPDGALMLSVADIPLGCLHFTGVIGVVLLHGKEYRLSLLQKWTSSLSPPKVFGDVTLQNLSLQLSLVTNYWWFQFVVWFLLRDFCCPSYQRSVTPLLLPHPFLCCNNFPFWIGFAQV